jgi:hypothetical protein
LKPVLKPGGVYSYINQNSSSINERKKNMKTTLISLIPDASPETGGGTGR